MPSTDPVEAPSADEISGAIVEMLTTLNLLVAVSDRRHVPFIEQVTKAVARFDRPELRREMVRLLSGEADELYKGAAEQTAAAAAAITERDDLLQEALSVLGMHRPTHPPYGSQPTSPTHCERCDEVMPCPEASLAEKIEKAIGGEG